MTPCRQLIDFKQSLFGNIDKGVDVAKGMNKVFMIDRFMFLHHWLAYWLNSSVVCSSADALDSEAI